MSTRVTAINRTLTVKLTQAEYDYICLALEFQLEHDDGMDYPAKASGEAASSKIEKAWSATFTGTTERKLSPKDSARIKCQGAGNQCREQATHATRWMTPPMSAPAFYYHCEQHPW